MQTFNKLGAILFMVMATYRMVQCIMQGRTILAIFQYLAVGICLVIMECLILGIRPITNKVYSIFIWPYYCIRGIKNN